MDWEQELQQKIKSFPEDIKKAHKLSIYNKMQVLGSNICGCFHCLSIFSPSEIVEWVDEDEHGEEITALCPFCGIDSVLGDLSGYSISHDFLQRMHNYWF